SDERDSPRRHARWCARHRIQRRSIGVSRYRTHRSRRRCSSTRSRIEEDAMTPPTALLPKALEPFAGHILDADSHEYTPMNMWEEQFGPVVREFVRAFEGSKMPIRRFVAADATEITAATVWNTKFASAPDAFDLHPRAEVLDFTGVRRQMMFPGSIGLYAVSFYFRCDQFPDMLKTITGNRKAYALELIRAY